MRDLGRAFNEHVGAGAIHSWFFVGETGEMISGVGLLGLVAAALSTWLTSVRSLVNLA